MTNVRRKRKRTHRCVPCKESPARRKAWKERRKMITRNEERARRTNERSVEKKNEETQRVVKGAKLLKKERLRNDIIS